MRLQLGSSLVLILSLIAWGDATSAATYQFLTVSSTGATTSEFTSANGNGVIKVSQAFSAGGAGPLNNLNSSIFPSEFTTLFPGTGQVQGHLAQTNSNSTSLISFDLTGYNLSPSTVFGIWNITNDVSTPVYDLKIVDAANAVQAPTTFNLIGNQDNLTQAAGANNLVLNSATGILGVGGLINATGIHTDAAFWNNIPIGTKQIDVFGNLSANVGRDGVGYYFAEVVPEPASSRIALVSCVSVGLLVRRRCVRIV